MEENKSNFKRFVVIFIIVLIIIVGLPIFNIILVSKGWHLKLFTTDMTKEIEGKTYVGISETIGWDYRKVTYYAEHNKFAFKKDEESYIVENFDFNEYKHPNSRYYYENGQIIKRIYFDEKSNIIEFNTESLIKVLNKKSSSYIGNDNIIENMYKYYPGVISIKDLPYKITLDDAINQYNYYAPGNTNNSQNYRYFIDKYLIKDNIFIRIVSQTENKDIIIKDIFYLKDTDKIYVITDTTRDTALPNDCRILTLSKYDVMKESLNDKKELQLVAYNNENNSEMCLIENLEK